jgi:hypothetical protein
VLLLHVVCSTRLLGLDERLCTWQLVWNRLNWPHSLSLCAAALRRDCERRSRAALLQNSSLSMPAARRRFIILCVYMYIPSANKLILSFTAAAAALCIVSPWSELNYELEAFAIWICCLRVMQNAFGSSIYAYLMTSFEYFLFKVFFLFVFIRNNELHINYNIFTLHHMLSSRSKRIT